MKGDRKQIIPKFAAVDLFCGIGGLTHGLKKSGIRIRAGIDLDESCRYAYETNNNAKLIATDISEIRGKDIEVFWKNDEIKVLVGCAPCQPFSTHSNKVRNREKGQQWNLLNHFLRLVEETNPSIVSMENVPNLSNQTIFHQFRNGLMGLGYFVKYQNVYCPDYGIPQKRRRLVLLASKYGEINLISPTHQPSEYRTVKEAIGKLEPLQPGEKSKKDKLHFTTTLSRLNLKRIRASKPNGTWEDWDESLWLDCHKKNSGKTYKSVYGRMSWKEPSPTITTQFYNYGTGRFGHPEQDRALTLREGSILQGFPEYYQFVDKDTPVTLKNVATHIGNAVPVDLGTVIGKSIISHIKNLKDV